MSILSFFTLLCFRPSAAQDLSVFEKDAVVSDTFRIVKFERRGCKNLLWVVVGDGTKPPIQISSNAQVSPSPRSTVHGNVSYDFLYRSRLDTPFKMNDFYQHAIRLNLQILYKGKVPLNFSTGMRISNSPFFRNFLDIGLRYDAASYIQRTKMHLARELIEKLPEKKLIDSLTLELKRLLNTFDRLKTGRNNSRELQRLVEEKEKILRKGWAMRDYGLKERFKYDLRSGLTRLGSISDADTSEPETMRQPLRERQREMAMIMDSSKKVRDAIEKNKQVLAMKSADLTGRLNNAASVKEMKALLPESTADSLGKGYWRLASLKSLDIGRGYLDYSELTAKDVVITGLQVEYNPSWYGAFAIGKIDYRFRDFINGPRRDRGQYLAIGRFGVGDLNKKAVILTVFKGVKSEATSFIGDSLQKMDHILGYALESRMSVGPQINFQVEVAKSVKPQTFRSDKDMGSLFRFDDLSNMGIRIEGQSVLTKKETRVKGYYKRTGEDFQSFNYFSYRTNRTAWLASVDQPLFKKKISVTAMVRQNDFVNPEAEQTFKATTVFKSFFLKMRFPHLPFISLGYYPGVQYFITEDRRLLQNAYYIFNGTATYSYRLDGLGMNSMVSFNSYSNKATDSGFSYYKGSDYFVSHSVFTASWNIRGSYNLHDHPDMRFFTAELAAGVNFKKTVNVGGSAQYNRVKNGTRCYGYTADLSINATAVGVIKLMYNKSYYPTPQQVLYPIEMGSVGLYKNF